MIKHRARLRIQISFRCVTERAARIIPAYETERQADAGVVNVFGMLLESQER